MKDKLRRTLVVLAILLVAAFLLIAIWRMGRQESSSDRAPTTEPVLSLTFADAGNIFWTTPTILARQEDLYKEFGLEVRFSDVQTGLAAKNAVLAGAADLGLVATTPIAAGALKDENSRLIATYVRSRALLKVARLCKGGQGDSLTPEGTAADWKSNKPRVGYVPGTISEFLLDRLREEFTLSRSSIRPTAVKPPLGANALAKGDLDYLIIWEPFVLSVPITSNEEGEKHYPCSFSSGDRYQVELHLVTRPETVEKKPKELAAFLKAVIEASRRLEGPDSRKYQGYVERWVGHEPGALNAIWKEMEFGPKRTEDINYWKAATARSIQQEAEWLAGKKGIVLPELNFEEFLDGSVLASATE